MLKLLKAQITVFVIGTFFGFYTIYEDFKRFYSYEGTLFKLKDCVVPNPVTTPCFYGSFAFLAGLILSFLIYKKYKLKEKFLKIQNYLLWLVEFGFIFAWTNFSIVFYRYLQASGDTFTGCSGVKNTTPFTTPCFYGSVIFSVALFIVFFTKRKLQSNRH